MTSPPNALVTGARRGIGRGIALALADAGFNVCINHSARTPESDSISSELKSKIEASGQKAVIYAADISRARDRAALLDFALTNLGSIDVLVNNAGVAPEKRQDLLETSEESFDRVLAINLKGAFFLSQLVANHMIEEKKARGDRACKIINISSISAYASSPNRAEYCISKAAVAMMTKLFADRLAEYGIQVFEVRPGLIATDMTRPVKQEYDKLIEEGVTPIKRWGTPEDVGKAVAAIAAGAFPFSTGEVINVDGGFHLRRF